MNRYIFFIILVALFLLSFSSIASQIPSSQRANQVIQNVTPTLLNELNQKGLRYGSPMFIRIFKETKELEVWIQGEMEYKHFKTYKICAFSGKAGPKLKMGDKQSPEGFYRITPQQLNPNSNYHLSMNLGYPNPLERTQGKTGGLLMIHGNCGSRGCYAMTDQRIEEIYTLAHASLQNGQRYLPVHAFPFKLTKKKMKKYKESRWYAFWQNLKKGYDYFEQRKQPPIVLYGENEYIFY